MSFKECLNEYIKQIQCTGKELAVSSGISETDIVKERGCLLLTARISKNYLMES